MRSNPNSYRAAARSALRGGTCIVLTVLLAIGEVRADYLKDYWDGREAYRNRKYREAVVFFDRAVKLQPAGGGRVRWTGTHFETYLPHYHLGRALYELGLYEQATRVWAESLRQGEIQRKQTRREYRELQKKLEAMRNERLPETLERIDRDVERTALQLERLQRRGIGGLVIDESQLEEATTLLAAARTDLSHARAQGEFAPLADAGKAVDGARMRILRALEAMELREDERRREAEAKRRVEAQRIYLETAARLEARVCDPETTRQLHDVLDGGGLPAELQTGPTPLLVLLSRAHELCGDLLGAQQYLQLALQEHEEDAERIRESYDRLVARRRHEQTRTTPAPETARESPDALERATRRRDAERVQSDYLVARVNAEIRGCDREALARMEALLASVLETDPPFDPHLDLARAHRGCGDRERTAHYLGLARRQRATTPDEVERLAEWLERTQAFDMYSESHALVIGVAHYQDEAWGALPEVLDDARQVAQLLERHGFRVRTLTDPTTAELTRQLERFFGQKRPGNSRLVFYYGGHGHTEINEYLRLGYIVPADTPFPENDPEASYLRHLISMDGFEGLATSTGADHAMFLFDSCFSGTIFDATRARVRLNQQARTDPGERLGRPVRLFVTAGDETQMVPAESRFRAAVVRALKGFADADADGLILGSELGDFVAEHGATPHNSPQWGVLDIPGYDAGDLAFSIPEYDASRAGGGTSTLTEELALWGLVAESENTGDLRRFLEDYPDGIFAALAAAKIERLAGSRRGRP